ncbi:MAG: hypothetical protein IMZ50_08785 [Candidatus Atribacteria bacterium]|nr:hypothetical protein [Candidatus Atribacteria bacterium]
MEPVTIVELAARPGVAPIPGGQDMATLEETVSACPHRTNATTSTTHGEGARCGVISKACVREFGLTRDLCLRCAYHGTPALAVNAWLRGIVCEMAWVVAVPSEAEEGDKTPATIEELDAAIANVKAYGAGELAGRLLVTLSDMAIPVTVAGKSDTIDPELVVDLAAKHNLTSQIWEATGSATGTGTK